MGKPVLIGHSIGGTFAAIFAASEPDRIQKLLLITAPLRFGVEAGALAPIVGGSLPSGMVAKTQPHNALTLSLASVPSSCRAVPWLL